MKSAVVVGGGVAGIVSAILLKRYVDRVSLIEKEDRVGGLLNSIRNEQGLWFDYGSHFLRETGVKELDTLLFGDITSDKWCILENLKGGGYFGSTLNSQSPFLDARLLPEDVYHQGMEELFKLDEPAQAATNLEEQLLQTFGTMLTDHLFRPILEGKFFGCALKELATDAHHLFGLSRILACDPGKTRELKKIKAMDDKLAFHSFVEGFGSARNFYPIEGGAGYWIEILKKKMDQLGVDVITGESINRIDHESGKIVSVSLSSGRTLDCDQLVWTIPVFHCVRAARLDFNPASDGPPQRLLTSLHHFSFDRPFLTPVQYVQVHEPSCATFRITIYPNIQLQEVSAYHLTAEVITRDVPDLNTLQEKIYRELTEMKIISPKAAVVYKQSDLVKEGFPYPTHQFVRGCKDLLEFAENKLTNATFLGKGTGGQFLVNDVLVHAYKTINDLCAGLKIKDSDIMFASE